METRVYISDSHLLTGQKRQRTIRILLAATGCVRVFDGTVRGVGTISAVYKDPDCAGAAILDYETRTTWGGIYRAVRDVKGDHIQ